MVVVRGGVPASDATHSEFFILFQSSLKDFPDASRGEYISECRLKRGQMLRMQRAVNRQWIARERWKVTHFSR